MSRDLEPTISKLKELLPYVARDAERYRNATELVTKSRELQLAAKAIDETLVHPSFVRLVEGPFLRLKLGTSAVEALGFRRNAYDLKETEFEVAEPGEEHDLLFKHRVATETFASSHSQPVYGHAKYFDLATMGRILESGGDLIPSEPGS